MKKSRTRNSCGRFRNWEIVCYDKPFECLNRLLASSEHYAYAYHDKDIKADGKPEEPHYHLLLILPDAKTATAIMSYNEGTQNVWPTPLENRLAMYRYLTHKDDKNKFQYPDDIVFTDDKSWWDSLDDTTISKSGQNIWNICADINAGKSREYLLLTYGYLYFIHRDDLELFAQILKTEKITKGNIDTEAIRSCPFDDFPF